MGYDEPKGDSGGLKLETQEWNVEHNIFEPSLPIVPVKLNF